MTISHPIRRRRLGAAAVEAAFVLPVLLYMVCAIYDYSRYFMLSQMVNGAVRAGARQAVVSTNLQDTSTIQNTVISYLSGLNLTNSAGKALSASDVSVLQVNPATGVAISGSNWYSATFGSSIEVTVTAKFKPMMPGLGFLPSTVTVIGTSVMSSEAN